MKISNLLIIILASAAGAESVQQATIVNTGSTNVAGVTVAMGSKGPAMVEHGRGGAKARMNVTPELQARLMKDLEAAGPMDQLNTRHCMKSASFGSRTFIEFKGVRSPDISCPGQPDPKVEALRVDVEEIMAEARKK